MYTVLDGRIVGEFLKSHVTLFCFRYTYFYIVCKYAAPPGGVFEIIITFQGTF